MKPRVLHVTPMYPSAENPAYGTFVKTQIDSLKKYAAIELLILPGGNGILAYIKYILPIMKIKKNQFDLIHVHYGNAASMVKIFTFARIPVITSYCGTDLLGDIKKNGKTNKKKHFFRILNKKLSKYDEVSIVKSEVLKDEITEISKRITVIPNGVDTTTFKEMDTLSCRKKLGITIDERKVLLFPADTGNTKKNYALVEKALKGIPKSSYQILTFKGKNVNPELVPLYLNASDLVVFTSLSEGSPNIIKEAMACNCLIYSTPCGDTPYLLDGVNGAKILPFDDKVWSQEIEQFLEHKSNAVSRNGIIQLQKKKLDIDTVAQKIAKLYEEVIRKKETVR